ncbi:hypothetical protein D9758_014998 [Tetrapyrgos nigripes]|uniref:NAD(P)-binding protein n=1 Tax=Tetrapyrgos nigripes TaxID=182062 RepID=A0A8H5CFK2_9AGAR|nr:hypothetical protein D9758_014998 [Tetrapyrgos nigripes]
MQRARALKGLAAPINGTSLSSFSLSSLMSSQQQLVWVITGTSSGLGHDLTLAALARGDKVIATARARSIGTLDDLNAKGADTLELDVTAPLDTLKEVAKKAVEIHGRVDVVVNSAGYILAGALEENTRRLPSFGAIIHFISIPTRRYRNVYYSTNVFGALNVTRAFLPYMRQRKTGTIVWMGSLTGWISGPAAGLYCTTKYALRGISGTLHEEISPLGLRSTVSTLGPLGPTF